MKKLITRVILLTLCLTMLLGTVTTASASVVYAPYKGYEYNSSDESVAAPIGYLPHANISGSDLKSATPIGKATVSYFNVNSPDTPSFYFVDAGNNRIVRADGKLNILEYFIVKDANGNVINLSSAKAIAADADNKTLYVALSGQVLIVEKNGTVKSTVSGISDPIDIAVNSMGELLILDGSRRSGYYVFDSEGEVGEFTSVGSNLSGLEYSADADLIMAFDTATNSVIDTYNETSTEIEVNVSSSSAFAMDSFGEMFYFYTEDGLVAADASGAVVSTVDIQSVGAKSTGAASICYNAEAEILTLLGNADTFEIVEFTNELTCIKTITELTFGFVSPSDINYYNEDTIYILDSGNSRILELDKELTTVKNIYSCFKTEDGEYIDFTGAMGMEVGTNGDFYICDTENYRVMVSDHSGKIRMFITRPDQNLANTDAPFRATKVVLDRKDRIYVICDSINLGAMVFEQDGEFLTFFGANTVNATAEIVLNYIRKRFMTKAQIAKLKKYTPIAISNLDVDDEGFIYTVTQTSSTEQEAETDGTVKRLNYNGDNIFTPSGNAKGFGDLEWDREYSQVSNTSFIDIDVDDEGFLNLVDVGRGKIFQYNSGGQLVTVFGTYGTQYGTFSEPIAIESVGDKIYVLDEVNASVMIFQPTEYIKALRDGFKILNSSDSDAILSTWQNVLKYNTNSQYPYYGIGMAYEMKGDYENAMDNFRLAGAKEEYSKAFREYRKTYVAENFWWLAIIIVVAIVVLAVATRIIKKKMVAKHGEAYSAMETKWGLPIYVQMHPVDGFEQFRNRNLQSIGISFGIVAVWFLAKVFEFFAKGFAFNSNRAVDYNLFATLLGTVILYVLFIISNWAVCTLLNGKGRMKEIIAVTAYALIPMIIAIFVNTILSNFLTLEESAFVSIIWVLGYLWSAIVLLLGLYTIHQYSFGATLGSTLLTIFGMAVIAVLVLMFFTLLSQTWSFIVSIITELKLR